MRESVEEKESLMKRIEELRDDIDMYQAEMASLLRAKAVPLAPRSPAPYELTCSVRCSPLLGAKRNIEIWESVPIGWFFLCKVV